jgi:hypothetical protein
VGNWNPRRFEYIFKIKKGKLKMSDITLVSMFYDIGRENWNLYPRKVQEYISAFEKFLDYDYTMIVFIDDKYIDKLQEKVIGSKITLIPINEEWVMSNLWSWSRLDREKEIMSSFKYQSLVQHRIDKNYPENVNPLYTILTHSKIDVVNYAIDNNLIDTDYVAWIDFGYFYKKTSAEFLPTGPLDLNKFDLNKVNICLINSITDRDQDVIYSLQYAPEKIGAYFFMASKEKMQEFQKLCHKWLLIFQQNEIADDEQGVWLQCYFDQPNLFADHVFYKWHQALREFSK